MNLENQKLICELIDEIKPAISEESAVALDFDGVCKLFTEHKHQIMFTLLFLHLYEFQRIPLSVFKKAYGYINFSSPDFAGKARFICVNALANYLADQGHDCRLPDLDRVVKELEENKVAVNAVSLKAHSGIDEVKRILAWSREVDRRLSELTEISLAPGVDKNIFQPLRNSMDFYVVSTATEPSIKSSLEKEGIDFIKRYFGQETCGKAEALTCLCRCGYKNVFMFGDSVEDRRASYKAMESLPENVNLFFCPVIPNREEYSFSKAIQAINNVIGNDIPTAKNILEQLEKEFDGKEAGKDWR